MKTKRKLHTRRLALNYTEPLHPVSYERGKALLAKLVDTIAKNYGTDIRN